MTDRQPPVAALDEDWSQRRSDARRNHERIVTAALDLFAQHGVDATMPDIARRAGVGKATVYRSFPTKADLVAAVAAHQMSWLEHRAVEAEAEADVHGALRSFLGDVAARLATDRVLADLVPDDGGEHGARIRATLRRLISQARKQGLVRSDITATDVVILFSGCIRQLTAMGNTNRATWRRYSALVVDAIST